MQNVKSVSNNTIMNYKVDAQTGTINASNAQGVGILFSTAQFTTPALTQNIDTVSGNKIYMDLTNDNSAQLFGMYFQLYGSYANQTIGNVVGNTIALTGESNNVNANFLGILSSFPTGTQQTSQTIASISNNTIGTYIYSDGKRKKSSVGLIGNSQTTNSFNAIAIDGTPGIMVDTIDNNTIDFTQKAIDPTGGGDYLAQITGISITKAPQSDINVENISNNELHFSVYGATDAITIGTNDGGQSTVGSITGNNIEMHLQGTSPNPYMTGIYVTPTSDNLTITNINDNTVLIDGSGASSAQGIAFIPISSAVHVYHIDGNNITVNLPNSAFVWGIRSQIQSTGSLTIDSIQNNTLKFNIMNTNDTVHGIEFSTLAISDNNSTVDNNYNFSIGPISGNKITYDIPGTGSFYPIYINPNNPGTSSFETISENKITLNVSGNPFNPVALFIHPQIAGASLSIDSIKNNTIHYNITGTPINPFGIAAQLQNLNTNINAIEGNTIIFNIPENTSGVISNPIGIAMIPIASDNKTNVTDIKDNTVIFNIDSNSTNAAAGIYAVPNNGVLQVNTIDHNHVLFNITGEANSSALNAVGISVDSQNNATVITNAITNNVITYETTANINGITGISIQSQANANTQYSAIENNTIMFNNNSTGTSNMMGIQLEANYNGNITSIANPDPINPNITDNGEIMNNTITFGGTSASANSGNNSIGIQVENNSSGVVTLGQSSQATQSNLIGNNTINFVGPGDQLVGISILVNNNGGNNINLNGGINGNAINFDNNTIQPNTTAISMASENGATVSVASIDGNLFNNATTGINLTVQASSALQAGPITGNQFNNVKAAFEFVAGSSDQNDNSQITVSGLNNNTSNASADNSSISASDNDSAIDINIMNDSSTTAADVNQLNAKNPGVNFNEENQGPGTISITE